jgi:hypothetical protein
VSIQRGFDQNTLAKDWSALFLVSDEVTLVLPYGRHLAARVRAGQHTGLYPRAILIDFVPEIDSQVPKATTAFVDRDVVERANRCIHVRP